MTLKRHQTFLVIATVATLVVATFVWSQKNVDDDGDGIQTVARENQQKDSAKSSEAIYPQIGSTNQDSEAKKEPLSFDQQFNLEVARMGQTHADPDALARDLDILASKLDDQQLRKLAKKVQDPNIEGDQRALAVDLLSRNHGELAAELLADFASSPVPQLQEPRRAEYEILLRGMAVEGVMQAHEQKKAIGLLNDISAKTDNSFLNDRSQRALNHLKGRGQSPAVQDKKALEKLIR